MSVICMCPSFWRVYIFHGWLLCWTVGVRNDGLALDTVRTRKEVTSSLGQTVNLGCYANNSNSPSFTYTWTKNNMNVTQSSNVKVLHNLLVITPQKSADFGTYQCHISDGRASTICSISLSAGCNDTEATIVTGCVNLSVLMPVLAVMMVSLLLNVHFLLQWRRRQQSLLSQEDIMRYQIAQESLEVSASEQLEEEGDKNETCFVGFRRRRKEKEEIKERIVGNDECHSKDEKNNELFEMQEDIDHSYTQDMSTKGQDTSQRSPGKEIPRLEHILSQPEISPIAKHSPRSLQDSPRTFGTLRESPRTDDGSQLLESPKEKEIPRLEDILSQPEISPIAKDRLESMQDSPRTFESLRDSPRAYDSEHALESAQASEIPRLEDYIGREETSSDERDKPLSLHIPRTEEIPRLEEFLWETKTRDDDEAVPDHSDANFQSAEAQAPRIADFFLPGDESDGERQSLDSEEPLVSHYMEKMDFEKGLENEERDEEPLVSHYMEKMHFEEKNDDDGPQLK
ncbi:uncharacterized protein [Montipora capricornis]|uniref:uncharacterized protein n=1 Tax=Montipora capricornis TaxID=246305 RepID=UPI0035F134DB